jgi:hypothetical protein
LHTVTGCSKVRRRIVDGGLMVADGGMAEVAAASGLQ